MGWGRDEEGKNIEWKKKGISAFCRVQHIVWNAKREARDSNENAAKIEDKEDGKMHQGIKEFKGMGARRAMSHWSTAKSG